MARIRAVLKWDRARNLGWAIVGDGTVFYVRRKNFRQPPIEDLHDGMVLEFSKLMNNLNFVERLYEGKERDNFSGNHRKPRPRGRGDFGKNALAVDITIVDGNLGRELEGLDGGKPDNGRFSR
jgi:hypothetical protein